MKGKTSSQNFTRRKLDGTEGTATRAPILEVLGISGVFEEERMMEQEKL
jgi:hypothetical protein